MTTKQDVPRGYVVGRDMRSYTWHVQDLTDNRRPVAQSGNAPRDCEEAFNEALEHAIKYQSTVHLRPCRRYAGKKETPYVFVFVVDSRSQIVHSRVLYPLPTRT